MNPNLNPCPVCSQDTSLPVGCDQCPPEGIVRPPLTALDILALFDDGIITIREFHMELASRAIDATHPCIQPGCSHSVAFDDEPYCFTHSPDEGSSVRGYSYMMNARRAQQTADSCDNFIM